MPNKRQPDDSVEMGGIVDYFEHFFAFSKIPMVLIVVQGGPNSLLLVEKSIKENIPILVLAVRFSNKKFFFIYLN